LIEVQKNKSALMDELVPSEFFLSQNYPNPFKGKTTIKYCLSENAKVCLAIFNSKDEKVKELFNKVQKAGTYETILDGRDLQAGVYYYQLKAVDPKSNTRQLFVKTKKMVLLKQ
jgi:hypothetical protein